MSRYKYKTLITALALLANNAPTMAQQKYADENMPKEWQYSTLYDQTSPTSDTWWKGFDDSMLDSLISMGVENNYNVLMAQRRIEIARQSMIQAKAGYFPTLNLNGGWTKSRTSGMMTKAQMPATTTSYFNLGVDMNWQIDVFGKITERAKGSKATYNATKAEYDATMVTVAAKIASAYFQLRSIQGQIDVTTRHIASQKRVLEITEARHEAGLSSMLDVTQARTTYYSTLASMSSLKSAETAAINSIAVLLGVYPDKISDVLLKSGNLPDYHHIVSVGVPMELLRRRPDIVEAEYQLAAYASALGVAKKDFLPTLSLNGSIGTASHDFGDMFKSQSLTYSVAPTLTWNIFDGMSRKASVASAKEQMMLGIDSYNATLITAVQEVETAMSAYSNDVDYIEYLKKVVDESQEALNLSLDLYKQGLTPFINVTNSQITLLQYSNELVSAKGKALADLVTLYESLGGGWQSE